MKRPCVNECQNAFSVKSALAISHLKTLQHYREYTGEAVL